MHGVYDWSVLDRDVGVGGVKAGWRKGLRRAPRAPWTVSTLGQGLSWSLSLVAGHVWSGCTTCFSPGNLIEDRNSSFPPVGL